MPEVIIPTEIIDPSESVGDTENSLYPPGYFEFYSESLDSFYMTYNNKNPMYFNRFKLAAIGEGNISLGIERVRQTYLATINEVQRRS